MSLSTCLASRAERRRPMPGDALVPEPMATLTHAITIRAPPHKVWPWLVQMGSGRAGWYSWDFVDNGGIRSADWILPELQHVAPGDVLPSIPGAKDSFVVRQVEDGRAIVLDVPSAKGPRASFELRLEPFRGRYTRLIARGRVSRHWLAPDSSADETKRDQIQIERAYGLLAKIPAPVMLPLAAIGHRVMQARQLRGIKRRAEKLARA